MPTVPRAEKATTTSMDKLDDSSRYNLSPGKNTEIIRGETTQCCGQVGNNTNPMLGHPFTPSVMDMAHLGRDQALTGNIKQGYLKELLNGKGRNTLARGRECLGPPKPHSSARTINMIIGGNHDASINSIKFTVIHKLKRSITHERYDRLEESIIFDKSDADGYNQILMEEEDQEKTTVITNRGTYYYRVIPFGLKNIRASYQRLVIKLFKDQHAKTMEVYIDDIFVKFVKLEDHIDYLKEAFDILRKYKMKLNPEKCEFGVASGKFLGFLVSQ
uniref:Uncharacterized protein LOC104232764 n=1 Tax=Nicotiana sylvestris TaxID=4096 RepID=A0A1U7X0K1_NICSY|nr:PREDICTED: uncharacterized protein LOC104232764 [Nicotiana sylvestris]